MDINIIEINKQKFGIPAKSVCSIQAPVTSTPLPFSPQFVEGLVNIGGEVICCHNLGEQLFLDPDKIQTSSQNKSINQKLLIIENNEDLKTAIRIDRAIMLANIDQERIRLLDSENEPNNISTEFLQGQFEWNGEVILLLDVNKLTYISNEESQLPTDSTKGVVAEELSNGTREADDHEEVTDKDIELSSETHGHDKLNKYLIVSIGTETFAIPLEHIFHVEDHQEVTKLPQAPNCVEGIIYSHNTPNLVVNLAALLNIPTTQCNKLVIVEHEGVRCALSISHLIGIKAHPSHQSHPVHGKDLELSGYIFESDNMIGVISVEALFTMMLSELVKKYVGSGDQKNVVTQKVPKVPLLTFLIGDEYCALPLANVVRVVEFQEAEDIPQDRSSQLAGVTNIKGDVLPVVDLREQIGAEKALSPLTAYIVAGEENNRWALVVDQVFRVIHVPETEIEFSNKKENYIEAIARINGKLVCVICVESLINYSSAA